MAISLNIVEKLIELKYPLLGIGFGQLIIADAYGYNVEYAKPAALRNELVDIVVRTLKSDISPQV